MILEERDCIIFIELTNDEYLKIEEYSELYDLSKSELTRRCTLTDFWDTQITMNTNDAFALIKTTSELISSIQEIDRELKSESIYDKNISSLLSNLKNKSFDTYIKLIETRQQIQTDIKEYHKDFRLLHILPIKTEKKIAIAVSSNELKIIERLAAEEKLSMSDLLKENIFFKCSHELKTTINEFCPNHLIKLLKDKQEIIEKTSIKHKDPDFNKDVIEKTVAILKESCDYFDKYYEALNAYIFFGSRIDINTLF